MSEYYFKKTSPEEAGVSSERVKGFLDVLQYFGFATHSVLMARGDKLFCEGYWKPFDKDFKHRMYSVSKSFVSIAVGFAIQDGFLSLDDKFVDFFPEYENENFDENLREVTIKDMLTMETSHQIGTWWLSKNSDDRTATYFMSGSEKVSGTIFDYDSAGSYMLGAIVEKLTGKKTFLDYLKEKVLDDIGFSKDSYVLMCPGGHSWGDSGVMCSSRDLLLFARFVMNKGVWNGKRYLSEEYINEATSPLVCNNNSAHNALGYHGYGYQIWMVPKENGFCFLGMGDQIAICDPDNDFIFVITSDNQGASPATRAILRSELFCHLIPSFSDKPLPENNEAYNELCRYLETRELLSLKAEKQNPFADEINGKTYKLGENKMGIEWIKLCFEGKKGKLFYKNAQSEKELLFGLGYNEFSLFPEENYSDMIGAVASIGHKYKCACSADWAEEKKLRIKVQIIDKYFANGAFVFSFKDDRVCVRMTKTAEAFLDEYEGSANGKRI